MHQGRHILGIAAEIARLFGRSRRDGGIRCDGSSTPRHRSTPGARHRAPVDGRSYLELTGAVDGRSHCISTDDLAAEMARGGGRYTVLCGRTVLAASLSAKPDRACTECRTRQHRR